MSSLENSTESAGYLNYNAKIPSTIPFDINDESFPLDDDAAILQRRKSNSTMLFPSSTSAGTKNTDSTKKQRVFKKDSIFYDGGDSTPPESIHSPIDETDNKPSKNTIFLQDFSAYPSAVSDSSNFSNVMEYSSTIGTPSKNSIFFQDFSTIPALRSVSLPVSSSINTPSKNHDALLSIKENCLFSSLSSVPNSPSSPNSSNCSSHEDINKKVFAEPKKLEPNFEMRQIRNSPSLMAVMDTIEQENVIIHYVPLAKNLLGEGRYASVYKGTYEETNRPSGTDKAIECAVKCLNPGDSEAQTNGIIEAYMLRKIKKWTTDTGHENIIQLITVLEEHPSIFVKNANYSHDCLVLALEYCPNGTLYDYVRANPDKCGRRLWINWCMQLTSAVAFLHAPHQDQENTLAIIHHDIKPHNVLLDSKFDVRLSDFGCASIVNISSQTSEIPVFVDGLGRGTQAYSPPEILTPPDFLFSFATDIYALGCTFYFLLTGREPFSSIRVPAHQLLSIRKGFFANGINPFPSAASLDRRFSRDLLPSLSLPTHVHTRSEEAEVHPNALLKFINGETLHSDIDNDALAYKKIVSLLRKCTALCPADRPSANEVMKILREIDDLLILGTGFDDIDSSRGKLKSKEINSDDSNDLLLSRVPGGRRAVYL